MGLTCDYLAGEPVNTVYVGGGTPSVYEPSVLDGLVPRPAPFPNGGAPSPSPPPRGRDREGEFTLELNPEDVTPAYVEALAKTRFNRISLGIQSFDDRELVWLGRSHAAEQSMEAVRLLQRAGFDNISIDLIFGIPGSTLQSWERNLDRALSLDVVHISAYALTVEPRTPLAWMIGKGKKAPVSDDLQAGQYRLLMATMKANGFIQYEISNFCRPGRESVHNSNYWKGVPYLGLGPSAHSYNGKTRRWNISNISEYIARIERGAPAYEEEILDARTKYNEYVMTSLRTMWGCDSNKIISDFGFRISDFFREAAAPFIEREWLFEHSGIYFLTDEGKLFADGITAELFLP